MLPARGSDACRDFWRAAAVLLQPVMGQAGVTANGDAAGDGTSRRKHHCVSLWLSPGRSLHSLGVTLRVGMGHGTV